MKDHKSHTAPRVFKAEHVELVFDGVPVSDARDVTININGTEIKGVTSIKLGGPEHPVAVINTQADADALYGPGACRVEPSDPMPVYVRLPQK